MKQRIGKGRIGFTVGLQRMNALHLHNEQYVGIRSALLQIGKFAQVLDPSRCRRIREKDPIILLQRDSFNLQVERTAVFDAIEIEPRITEFRFLVERCQVREKTGKILRGDGIGRLTVHIDEPICLIHGHEIICCLAQRIRPPGQNYLCPRYQKLPASSGVLHVTNDRLSVQKNVRDESVGTIQKDRIANSIVFHEK